MIQSHKIIRDLKSFLELISLEKNALGTKFVFTNGCFDMFHIGHLDLLIRAKELGNKLIVGVNSNQSIKNIKGDKRPIINENDRISILSELECVDYIIKFDEDTPYALIMLLKPDVLVKGDDWANRDVVGGHEVESMGGKVVFIKRHYFESTSNIIKRIFHNYDIKVKV